MANLSHKNQGLDKAFLQAGARKGSLEMQECLGKGRVYTSQMVKKKRTNNCGRRRAKSAGGWGLVVVRTSRELLDEENKTWKLLAGDRNYDHVFQTGLLGKLLKFEQSSEQPKKIGVFLLW